jgi:hypothetical protein
MKYVTTAACTCGVLLILSCYCLTNMMWGIYVYVCDSTIMSLASDFPSRASSSFKKHVVLFFICASFMPTNQPIWWFFDLFPHFWQLKTFNFTSLSIFSCCNLTFKRNLANKQLKRLLMNILKNVGGASNANYIVVESLPLGIEPSKSIFLIYEC